MKRCAVLVLALGCLFSLPAGAQFSSRRAVSSSEALAAAKRSAPQHDSLRERSGVAWAERALRESDVAERERALDRLAALGTPRALELLVKSLDPNGFAQTPRERLLAVRGMSPSAHEPRVRDCLMRVMTGISAAAERSDPLQALLRDTAALALAQSGEAGALVGLARALRQPGRVAQAARAALVAYPPANLRAVVNAHGAPTLELVRVLDELDDQRAFETLRAVVERGSGELRAEAALALTRLGHFETVALARRWASQQSDPLSFAAATEILALAHDPKATDALRVLLARAETREHALALSRMVPDAALEPELVQLTSSADPSDLPAILAALARAPGKLGLQALEKFANQPATAELAVQALARAPGNAARALLERLLARSTARRLAARAGVIRAVSLTDPPQGLGDALEALLASKAAADRAVGAFGIARLEPSRARELVSSADSVIAEAAARAAPFVDAALTAADRLAREPAGRLRTQLALALVDPRARDRVPTGVLIDLVEERGLATPIALYALAERDSEAIRGRLLEQLASPDPWLRAQVALGLGESEDPSALGLLEGAYRFEPEPRVRRALVQGAARRGARVRRRILELAGQLDPDPATRTVARLALRSIAGDTWSVGPSCLFATLERTDGAARGAIVTAPGGLTLPVLADPDGVLALAGLAAGPLEVRVALVPGEDKSRSRGAP